MRLSTKGRYAVTAMLDLAIQHEEGPVTLADISRCQGISLSYLEQLFAKLRKQGLVEGVRGPGGGYRLAKGPGEISMAQIITAVDENADPKPDAGGDGSEEQDNERCLTRELWRNLSTEIYDFLDGVDLAAFLERPAVREVVERRAANARKLSAA